MYGVMKVKSANEGKSNFYGGSSRKKIWVIIAYFISDTF